MKITLKTEDVLSVTTGRILGEDMHSVMNHLFPGVSFPNGYMFIADTAAQALLAQFPKIKALPECTEDNFEDWTVKAKILLGDTLEVEGPVIRET